MVTWQKSLLGRSEHPGGAWPWDLAARKTLKGVQPWHAQILGGKFIAETFMSEKIGGGAQPHVRGGFDVDPAIAGEIAQAQATQTTQAPTKPTANELDTSRYSAKQAAFTDNMKPVDEGLSESDK